MDMSNCEQTKGLSILEHGRAVAEWYAKIYNREDLTIFTGLETEISYLIARAKKPYELKDYHVFHDCGKPYCLSIDEDGRRHFPNHAEISYNTWITAGGCDELGWYIKHDMDMHLMSVSVIEDFLTDGRYANLLLTAWAEIFANAQMFGGTDSISFKIKKKHLSRITKKWYSKNKNVL